MVSATTIATALKVAALVYAIIAEPQKRKRRKEKREEFTSIFGSHNDSDGCEAGADGDWDDGGGFDGGD